MWVSRRELARMQRELQAALRRAVSAEERLELEREAKDKLVLAMLDHRSTKDGGYAISSRLPLKEEPEPIETRDVYFERLKATYPMEWAYYSQVAQDSNRPESEALDWLDRFHRKLPMPFEQTM